MYTKSEIALLAALSLSIWWHGAQAQSPLLHRAVGLHQPEPSAAHAQLPQRPASKNCPDCGDPKPRPR
jgi:hypothetical protein